MSSRARAVVCGDLTTIDDDYYTHDAYEDLINGIIRLCIVDIANAYFTRFMVTGVMPNHPSEIKGGGVNFNTAVIALTKNHELLDYYENLKTEDFFRMARQKAIQKVEDRFKNKILTDSLREFMAKKSVTCHCELDPSLTKMKVTLKKKFCGLTPWSTEYELSKLTHFRKSDYDAIHAELRAIIEDKFVIKKMKGVKDADCTEDQH